MARPPKQTELFPVDALDRQREVERLTWALEAQAADLAHLQARLAASQAEVARLTDALTLARLGASGLWGPSGEMATLTRELLVLCHPDKWSQGQLATELAHELTVRLNQGRS